MIHSSNRMQSNKFQPTGLHVNPASFHRTQLGNAGFLSLIILAFGGLSQPAPRMNPSHQPMSAVPSRSLLGSGVSVHPLQQSLSRLSSQFVNLIFGSRA